MDPVTAGGLLALLFVAMDLFALPYWKFSTWAKPDLLTGARDRRDRPARRRTPARVNCGGGRMELTVATILVAFAGVFLSRAARQVGFFVQKERTFCG